MNLLYIFNKEARIILFHYMYVLLLAIPAILNVYSVKLTLRIVTAISVVKFIACGCVAVFGIYYLIVNG